MIETPEPPHHHHAGIPWFDIMMGVAILCISIASLLTSLQSEKSMHALVEQNSRLVSAQSTPLLMLDSDNQSDDGKPILSMKISNVGTGPAQIGWFRATDADGHNFSGYTVEREAKKVDPALKFATEQISSTLLRSGDKRLVFSWPKPVGNPAALAEWDRVNQARFRIHPSACYCSIFDECKITEFGSSHPKPVESCSQDQHNSDQ